MEINASRIELNGSRWEGRNFQTVKLQREEEEEESI